VTRQLREFDRCRVLYEKFLEFNPANVYAWIKYAELENLLEEVWPFDGISMEAVPHRRSSFLRAGSFCARGRGQEERCRGIFELAIGQPLLDMPEVLWKAYIGTAGASVRAGQAVRC